MPTEHAISLLNEILQYDSVQVKLCSDCHRPLTADASHHRVSSSQHHPPSASDAGSVCNPCREKRVNRSTQAVQSLDTSILSPVGMDVDGSPGANSSGESCDMQLDNSLVDMLLVDSTSQLSHERPSPFLPDLQMSSASSLTKSEHSPNAPGPMQRRGSSNLSSPSSPNDPWRLPGARARLMVVSSPPSPSLISSSRPVSRPVFSPDPLVDITHLRVRSQTYGCLYPGATFQGTQKSGRNSYDVTVTIVDVDFGSSFLCGYLRIRGLTDDWPELTTYFDAEIIGGRYGFLTQGWGATEQEDMVHWARFPAFRHVQNELQKPNLTIKERDHGAVFMRWKERFLVPDHRVQDINGASFAGFYYVCVDMNPPRPNSPTSASFRPHDLPVCLEDGSLSTSAPSASAPKPEIPLPIRRGSSSHGRRARRSYSPAAVSLEEPVPTMCGFYYHQNSEPYQQLSLTHVKEPAISTFEFR